MKNTKNTDHGSYMKKQTAAAIAAVCFFAGFLGGVIFAAFKTPATGVAANQAARPAQSADRLQQARMLESLVATDPDNVEAWKQLGHFYFDEDQYAKAIAAYEKALSLDAENADVWTDLGVMYRRDGDSRKAIECFDRAIAADPSHQNARLNKGIVLMHDFNDQEGAIRAWEELLEINPLAMAGNGQSVDQLITHYKKHVRKTPE
jgi:cytochrome c-type biogenesis protein CcmH/NrfG